MIWVKWIFFIFLGWISCVSTAATLTPITVGVLSGPYAKLMQVAKTVGAERFHLDIQIKTYANYHIADSDLVDGKIAAIVFQDLPSWQHDSEVIRQDLKPVGHLFIFPMGLYSNNIRTLSDLPENATVAIPNDPQDQARALLLLQHAGLIQLKSGVGTDASLTDIVANPHNLQFQMYDNGMLTEQMKHVSLAAINFRYVLHAWPSKFQRYLLLAEGARSSYVSVVLVRVHDRHKTMVQQLLYALHSPEVIQAAEQMFDNKVVAFSF